jgi:hypothetical protein
MVPLDAEGYTVGTGTARRHATPNRRIIRRLPSVLCLVL